MHMPLPFGFPLHWGHPRTLRGVPCALQQTPISHLIHAQQCTHVSPATQLISRSLLPLAVHVFVLCICVSISALQLRSPIPFFQIPHTSINVWCLLFSFWLTSLCDNLQVHPHLYKWPNFLAFLWLSNVHWKDWCWSWNSSTLATPCEELTHWKRPWCWEGLGAGEEGDDRGWDGWMVSPTRWAWVWVNSRSWWWTGRPGVLRIMGSQRVRHDWVTELNWMFHYIYVPHLLYPSLCWWTSRLLPYPGYCG